MYEKSCASSNHIKSWKDIDFGTAEYEVKKLQILPYSSYYSADSSAAVSFFFLDLPEIIL